MIFFWLIIAVSNLVSGKGEIYNDRIVGGYEVKPHFKYSFMTSLQKHGRHFCGGTLITGDTVITAAHCVPREKLINTEAVFHRHEIVKPDQYEHGIRRRVIKYITHPGYNSETSLNDISLWKLKSDVNIRPNIFLDISQKPLLKGKGTVIGWGLIEEEGYSSPNLLEVKIPFFPTNECQKVYGNSGKVIDKISAFCAGLSSGGFDSCQGDSGGPLFIERNNRTVLMGLVSWGAGCAKPNAPGVYTKVTAYKDWLMKHI